MPPVQLSTSIFSVCACKRQCPEDTEETWRTFTPHWGGMRWLLKTSIYCIELNNPRDVYASVRCVRFSSRWWWSRCTEGNCSFLVLKAHIALYCNILCTSQPLFRNYIILQQWRRNVRNTTNAVKLAWQFPFVPAYNNIVYVTIRFQGNMPAHTTLIFGAGEGLNTTIFKYRYRNRAYIISYVCLYLARWGILSPLAPF